jgi:hypothetical protein
VIALEPIDALVEVGGVPAHVDRVAHAQSALSSCTTHAPACS